MTSLAVVSYVCFFAPLQRLVKLHTQHGISH